jgi:Putative 8-oxoguanine DNA glycosylase OGG-like protein
VLRVFQEWHARGRPVQAPVRWQHERWLAVMPRQPRVLETLRDCLDRATVPQLVLEKPLTTSGMFEAMVIVYICGWSMSRIGVTRAQTALGAGIQAIGSALLVARDAVLNGDPVAGYAALAGPHRVPGLGLAC